MLESKLVVLPLCCPVKFAAGCDRELGYTIVHTSHIAYYNHTKVTYFGIIILILPSNCRTTIFFL